MKICLERTGGFAGISRTKTVDTTDINDSEVNELTQLLTAADFFNLPPHIASSSNQPDRFYYRLTVEDRGTQSTVSVSEAAMPESLRKLIEWINCRK